MESAALSTPGICARCSTNRRWKTRPSAASYPSSVRSTLVMYAPEGSNPDSMSEARWSERSRSPAPVSSTSEKPTCAATNIFRRRPDPLRAAPSSFREETRERRVAWRAGSRPKTRPVAKVAAEAKSRTCQSGDRSTWIGMGKGSRSSGTRAMAPTPIAAPAAPPSTKMVSDSVRSWRTRRRRPEPSARRTAISFSRAVARATNMPATFAHVTRRMSATMPMRMPRNAFTGPRPAPGTRPRGTTAPPRRALVSG